MQDLTQFWSTTDIVGGGVVLLLLGMSVSAWVVILWKTWVLKRTSQDIERAIGAFWNGASLEESCQRLTLLDREHVLQPLVVAVSIKPAAGTLETNASVQSQLTRRLRDALHRSLNHLQFGQVLLATIGSTAPFVGLFGTVWGIYLALQDIGATGHMTIDRVAGPIGEALVMTAAGLAVAIPAVLAYNLFGKWVGRSEAELEGFAHDLREMMLDLQNRQPHPNND